MGRTQKKNAFLSARPTTFTTATMTTFPSVRRHLTFFAVCLLWRRNARRVLPRRSSLSRPFHEHVPSSHPRFFCSEPEASRSSKYTWRLQLRFSSLRFRRSSFKDYLCEEQLSFCSGSCAENISYGNESCEDSNNGSEYDPRMDADSGLFRMSRV